MATFIAGPCVIESMELLDTVAQELVRINQKLGTDIIFKASFDKANRTSIHSFRGPGMEKGLQMLSDIKSKYGLRITTDIHESYQAEAVGKVCDSSLPLPPDRPSGFCSQDRQDCQHQEGTVPERKRYEISCRKSLGQRCQGSVAH